MSVQCGYSNPIDFLEYVLRCQNWGDNVTGVPSASALIRSGAAVGSFDSTTLDSVRAINIKYQIGTVDSSYTKSLIDKICKQFNLLQYTDVDGYECVRYLFAENSDETLVTVYSINDTIDNPIVFTPPPIEKICVNPFVKYNYDYATQQYIDELRINNVQVGTYNTFYTSGFQGSDGQTIWNKIRSELWPLVKHVEPMDQEISENQFIVDYAGALFRMYNIIEMMKMSTVEFELPFETGYQFDAGDITFVHFPHLSYDGGSIKMLIIKSVSKSKQDNRCTITGYLRDVVVGKSFIADSRLIELFTESVGL